MSFWGPMLGSIFTSWGAKSCQEPSKSDCDTIFVDFEGVQEMDRFLKGRGGGQKSIHVRPGTAKGRTKTPRGFAREVSVEIMAT